MERVLETREGTLPIIERDQIQANSTQRGWAPWVTLVETAHVRPTSVSQIPKMPM